MHTNTFLRIVQEEAGLRSLDEAKTTTQIVFNLLSHRLTLNEADDVRAQLPTELKAIWSGGEVWTERLLSMFTPQNKFDLNEFVNHVDEEAHNKGITISGQKLTWAVFYALQNQISAGEALDVAAQLPGDLKAFWCQASPSSTYPGGGGPENEPVASRRGPDITLGDTNDYTL